MFRHAIYIFAFVLSLTTAQAETPENYFGFGVSDGLTFELRHLIDEILRPEDGERYTEYYENLTGGDVEASGHVLTFGRRLNDIFAIEGTISQHDIDNYRGEGIYVERSLTEDQEVHFLRDPMIFNVSGKVRSLEMTLIAGKKYNFLQPFVALGYIGTDATDLLFTRKFAASDHESATERYRGVGEISSFYAVGVDAPIPNSPLTIRFSHKAFKDELGGQYSSLGVLFNF